MFKSFIFILLASALANANEKQYIDIHAHVACYGYQSDCYVHPRVKKSYKFLYYQKIFNFTKREAKKFGDGHLFKKIHSQLDASKYVKGAVILSMDQNYSPDGVAQPDKTEFYVPNDFVYTNAKKYPTLHYGASVHPYRKDALAQLELAKERGAVLVKLLPAIHHFHADEKRMIPYYRKLNELGLPLLIHMDEEHSFTNVEANYSDPAKLKLPLSMGVRVICAHTASLGKSGGEENYERLLKLKKKYPNNLFADISALTVAQTRKGHLKRAVTDSRWEGSLVYGSDYPLFHPILASPYFYIFDLGIKKTVELIKTKNPWDRDILLKKSLGAKENIFKRSASILNL